MKGLTVAHLASLFASNDPGGRWTACAGGYFIAHQDANLINFLPFVVDCQERPYLEMPRRTTD
jgi:hypothetical protein